MQPTLPVAATIDLQYRLPPPQQLLFTPTIAISLVVLGIAVIIMIHLSRRSRQKARAEARREALRTVERVLLKRGGTHDDVDRMLFVFQANPKIDPSAMVMIHEQFLSVMRPKLEKAFDKHFADRMELLYFPPPKETRRALAGQTKDVKELVEEQKSTSAGQTAAAIVDLMDATLKPGVVARLAFEGIESAYECLVMGHDMQTINVTLPAHNDRLMAALHPGVRIEGTLESGPSLMAFTSSVLQAVAGSMPYLRMAPWKSAWEIRKRDSMRLPISLDIDFQHISTVATDNIRMSNLNKEIGTLRPGRLMDISLGGCAIETPSGASFRVGDMIRFAKSLVTGNPPATLLGALVNVDQIDPQENEGSVQRLHVQFLIIDAVSQRILVRTLRQLQDVAEKNDWMQAQSLLQKMRRNRIQNIGSPAAAGLRRGDTDVLYAGGGSASKGTGKGTGSKAKGGTTGVKPGTRNHPKVGARPPTRRVTGVGDKAPVSSPTTRPADSSLRRPPPSSTTRAGSVRTPLRTGESSAIRPLPPTQPPPPSSTTSAQGKGSVRNPQRPAESSRRRPPPPPAPPPSSSTSSRR